jgi:hypothetical protein
MSSPARMPKRVIPVTAISRKSTTPNQFPVGEGRVIVKPPSIVLYAVSLPP